MSLQQLPAGEGEEVAEEPRLDGSHSSHEQQQAAPEEQQAAAEHGEVELQQAAAWGLPPALARHSAPLPVLLHRLSPVSSAPPSPGGPLATSRSPRAAQGDDASSEAVASPFSAASLDPTAVAAAVAAAAVVPAAGEEHEARNQRSITRLMGECAGLRDGASCRCRGHMWQAVSHGLLGVTSRA